MKAYRVAFTVIVDNDYDVPHLSEWLQGMVDSNYRVDSSVTYSFKELPYDDMPDEQMNLYLLSQNQRNGYDTFDSLVVAAYSEEQARLIGPSPDYKWEYGRVWAYEPDAVKVTLIGVAAPDVRKGVVLASFNAG